MSLSRSSRQALSANAIDIISDAIVWFDEKWIIIDANKSFLSFIGNIGRPFQGSSLSEYFNPVEQDWQSVWDDLINSDKEVNIGLVSITDQTQVVGSLRLASKETGSIGMLILKEVSKTQSYVFDDMMLQSIIDLSPAHINYYDSELNFLCVNKGFLSDFNLSKEEVIGKSVFQVVGQYMTDFSDQIKSDLNAHKGGEFFTNLTLPGVGENRYYHGIYEPHFASDGMLIGYTMIVMDMTKQKSIENALRESESKLKLSLDASKTGIFEFQINSGYSVASDNFYHLLGYEPQEFELTFEKWISLVHPEDIERARQQFNDYINSNNENYRSEYRMLRKEGTYQWMSLIGKVVEVDEKDNAQRIIGITTDVHFRKQVEDGMRVIIEATSKYQGANFFKHITQKLSEFLLVKFAVIAAPGQNGTESLETLALWEVNHQADILKYPLKGTPCELVYKNKEYIHLNGDLASEFPDDPYLKEHGIFSYFGIPFFNSEQQISGHLYIMDDKELKLEEWMLSLMRVFANAIGSELDRVDKERKLDDLNKSLETKVKKRTQQLRDAIEELDTFFYRASHDLRGPITTLKGISNLMSEELPNSDPDNNYVDLLCEQITRMDALNVSIIEVGNIRKCNPQKVNTDLSKVINNVMEELSLPSTIQFNTQLDHSKVIQSDPNLLHIMLKNIIHNSIIYRDEGQGKGSITVKSVDDDQGIQIIVEDDGSGFTSEISDQIFTMFFKGSIKGDGFGLGLYKAKMAASKLKVNLQLESVLDKGTMAIISLRNHE